MKSNSTLFIGLLRGINVTGHNRISMRDLCSLCTQLGWKQVQSYIQSGNLVFSASGETSVLENKLEKVIQSHLGLSISVMIRPAREWNSYIQKNPFCKISKKEPQTVLLGLTKKQPHPNADHELNQQATLGEQVVQTKCGFWIHFPRGVGKSKLTPALLDRIAGSPVTLRNWRTVLKIQELIETSDSQSNSKITL